MGDMKRLLILMLELLLTVLIVQGQPSLSIKPATWYTGTTLTFTCDLTGFTTVGVNIFKGTDQIYTCPFTNSPCSHRDGLSDYSDIDWSQADKAVLTISKASSTRDDGDWTCSGDDTTQKSNEVSLIITATTVPTTTVPTTTVPTTTASADSSNNESAPTDTSTESSTITTPATTYTDNSTPTSPTGVTDTSAHTRQRFQKLGLSDEQRIGLIAGGVGVVVVICCSICICAIMRRKVNKKKRRRRQETKQEVEANVQISETL